MRTDYLIETDDVAATETITLLVDGTKALGMKLALERSLGVVLVEEVVHHAETVPAFAHEEFTRHLLAARHRLMCRTGPTHIGFDEPTTPSPRKEPNS